jgi:DNA-binding Lrp family transcriptional regulator
MVLGLSAALLTACSEKKRAFNAIDVSGSAMGQDFAISDHNGQVRRLADFKGKVVVVFFGYTQCPDVCPTTMTALVEVTLDAQGAEHLNAFEARAVAEDAVQQCWRVSPGPDFVLVIQARDMPDYLAVTQRLLTQNANVRNVKAFFSLKRAKFSTKVPLPV